MCDHICTMGAQSAMQTPIGQTGLYKAMIYLAFSNYGCSFWTQMFRKRTGV
jgi:hypothetical protein